MPIAVTGDDFRLDTATTSYWLRRTPFGHLEHLYYGPRLPAGDAEPVALKRTAVLGASVDYDPGDPLYSLDTLPLEWSGQGYGDYRFSPVEARMPDGVFASDFTYVGHEVVAGCVPIDTLPSAYDGDQTLRVTLADEATGVELDLYWTVFEAADVVTRRAVLRNAGSDRLTLRRLLSGMVDLPNRDLELHTFDGGWIKEAHRHVRPLTYGTHLNGSTTGASSNRHNPGFLLAESTATQDDGWVFGVNLIYSGNHLGVVELSNHDLARVGVGIHPDRFEWVLEPGEAFETPEMVLTVSDRGLNGASHHFHDFVGRHVVRGPWRDRERPVLLNNWEAHFFSFTESTLLDLAKRAKAIGVELFVLDDGWFGARDSDSAGLGDYEVNRRKLPGGLDRFATRLKRLGLDFGLWFEPEMVNEDSDLFREHPDWAVRTPGRRTTRGRNQLVLDLCNPKVQDHIIESVGRVLDSADITYVKWDMNRHVSDAYSPTLTHQGEFHHRYVRGLYRVLREIFEPRPHILLESCSSGGNRFDLGMLCFSPQIWASDDTDPVERLKIQEGLSYLYPPSTWAAHVSGAPHQQTLRATPLSTRFNVAAFGVLGYELDLKYLGRLELKELREQVDFYRRHRRTLQFGRFSRVRVPKGNKVQWQVVARDGASAVTGYFQTLAQASEGFDRLRVIGLAPTERYRIETRPQYLPLRRFGELVKHILPVELNPDGLVMRTAGKVRNVPDDVERYDASGAMLASGVLLHNQFVGSHYNEQTRLLGDFGSNLYVVELIDE
ncbi:alpha-galactosidase [Xylanimonas ulmi]|uniref:Alpha-galactosidase n=1 Tax=Xylanimonas ulmi TaxID=228973 RepID=A0A4Q7M4I1_9MICO|nr:alpha-galactosidase [Xylanibacterium ulmi]RZS62281.1 alpha-galactosidase [Xylanibacterium ulmi]